MRTAKELAITTVTLLAIFYAVQSICASVEHQFYLHRQSASLKIGEAQAQEINKELREGLTNYRSSEGVERLARERLNLAGVDEILVRIGK